VNFRHAKIDGSFVIDNDVGSQFTLDLTGATLGGDLDVGELHCTENTRVDLQDASCKTLIDAAPSWPSRGNLVLDGFVYHRLREPSTAETRIDWLQRQLSAQEQRPDPLFRGRPYRQLAAVLREMQADENEAAKILIAMADDHLKFGELKRLARSWQWILGRSIGYGYAPFRALRCLIYLWLFGFVVFGYGYQMRVMVPSERSAYEGFVEGALPSSYTQFCALVYSIDTSLPIIGFGQKDRWNPGLAATRLINEQPYEPRGLMDRFSSFVCEADFADRFGSNQAWTARSTFASVLEFYRLLHLVCGWFLATMLVAGLTGLVGRK
jgi:hypothetical protein